MDYIYNPKVLTIIIQTKLQKIKNRENPTPIEKVAKKA
jgi:GTP-binding protein EngB required for normal cell division